MPSADPAVPREGTQREEQVQRLFSEIAPRYDLLNHVLSMNIDRGWRRKAVDRLGWDRAPDGTFLDACAGTFDLALELSGRPGFGGRVVASDFAQPMMVHGLPKVRSAPVLPVCGDTLRLPFADESFDGVTVGFGVRNLADLPKGLAEFHRVLRPGGRLVVLEFTVPPNPLVRTGYLFYFHRILPLVGRIVSGHPWAYSYLPESVKEFPGPSELEGLFSRAGFRETGWKLVTFGIAAIHWGTK
ncbi:MAG: class I SAM-dependent methyltransferase [Gemmatimonadota bacterium]|nr:class I SAM-dependent methyltransferase [Gemmatimonadota bacterium]MDH5758134.1 class I SAM-dependent methyltransferase [Gemmatimonadota bacterium]